MIVGLGTVTPALSHHCFGIVNDSDNIDDGVDGINNNIVNE